MSVTLYPFQIGNFKCYALLDGHIYGKAEQFFVGPTEEERAAVLEKAGIQPDKVPSFFTPLFIDTGKHRILVDTGVGEEDSEDYGFVRKNLASIGLNFDDIDLLIISHAHADHIGLNTTVDGMPMFPNARYLISKDEWYHWTDPHNLANVNFHTPHIRKNLLGIADRFEQINHENEIVPGIRLLKAPGHTPGHAVIQIFSNGEHLIYAADALLNPLHLEFLGWNYHSDADKMAAIESRRRIARLAVETDALVMGYHFACPGIGHIVETDDGWRWQPTDA